MAVCVCVCLCVAVVETTAAKRTVRVGWCMADRFALFVIPKSTTRAEVVGSCFGATRRHRLSPREVSRRLNDWLVWS